ncbi:MAG: hypothetical protein SF052_26665 [Bacteroidia bacterium]|nr:hypothetical protein [Bacteroidia bacterium]
MNGRLFIPLLTLLNVLSLAPFAQGQNVLLNYFSLASDGADILLEWELPDEANVVEYRIFRRINEDTNQDHIVTLPSDGSGKYQYLDDGIFKTTSRVIHYDLQIITGGKTYTFTSSMSHNPTSIQRTWGSIKSMFKP